MNDINIFATFALVNGIVSVTFGALIIYKNWRDRMNQIFFLMTGAWAVWSFSYWQWQLAGDYNTAFMWVKILSIASLFIPIFFYHWVTLLITAKTFVNKLILWLSYGVAFAILPLVNSRLFIYGLSHKMNFPFWPTPGVAYDMYFIFLYVGLIIYTLYILMRTYITTDSSDKKGQILYVILGGIIGFGGGLTNFPLWWNIPIPPYGNIVIAMFPFLLGYSIIKYNLFNIKTILSEMIAFTLVIFMLIIVVLAENTTLRLIYGVFLVLTSIAGFVLVKSSYALSTANAKQESILHFISHEVKGFLTKDIDALSMLAEGDFGTLPDSAKTFAEEALAQSRESIKSVIGILQAANLKKGTVMYHMIPTDIAPIVTKSFSAFQQVTHDKGISFTLLIDQHVGQYMILADAEKLSEHVFRNLIGNAVAYTIKGSVVISLSKNSGGKIVFSVKDTGVGINEEDKKRLFTEGGHGENSIKVNAHSTGYGLYIAKSIIEAHKGTVRVESDGDGKGSLFIVEFPSI